MSDTYKLFEIPEDSPNDHPLEPIATVNTLGEALAALDLRAVDKSRAANRFLVQRNDEPPMTIEEIRDRLLSEDKVGFRP